MSEILLSMQTPGEAALLLAGRMKDLRLARSWTRETLARRAGVSAASLKRFETSGAASLELVFRLAFALGRLEDFTSALQPPEASSLAELQARFTLPGRKRGRL